MTLHPKRRFAVAGFSLIELLVSMAIGLVVTLAITIVLMGNEGSKRSTTSVNEVNQTGAYIAYVLDRHIRSAGSGFTQSWADTFGCMLDVAFTDSGVFTQLLPLPNPGSFPAPFDQVKEVRLVPVLIRKNGANVGSGPDDIRGDVLTVMAGTAGTGETQQSVQPNSITDSLASSSPLLPNGGLRFPNTVGYRGGDLVLIADSDVPGGCMMQQINAPVPGSDQLAFGGKYAKPDNRVVNLSAFGGSPTAVQLGNPDLNNPAKLLLYGVGDNNTLFSYDLLQPSSKPVPLAEGVVEMRAVYGVDTEPPTGNPVWVDPGNAASGYTPNDLNDGSQAARAKLRRIVAIRLGLILRTSLEERCPPPPPPATTPFCGAATLTLFGDLGLPQPRNVAAGPTFYRYRTVEVTIPLRNVLLAPSS